MLNQPPASREISEQNPQRDINKKGASRSKIVESHNQNIVHNIVEAEKLLTSSALQRLDPKVKQHYSDFLEELQRNASQDVSEARKGFFTKFSGEKKIERAKASLRLETKLSNSKEILDLLQGGNINAIQDYTGLTITYSRGSNLDQEAFAGNPKDAVKLALDNNRIDVLNNLRELTEEQGIPLEIPAFSAERVCSEIAEIARTPYTAEGLLEGHPKPPEGKILSIHKGSLKMFKEAESGHIFTGLVQIRNKGTDVQDYKIFLAPIQPSKGSDRDPNKIYPGRLHEKPNSSYTIYRQKVSPLYHLQQIGDKPPQHGHAQLAGLIRDKSKHQDENLTDGQYIGFTVIKGKIKDGLLTKIIPTSNQSNPFTFPKENGEQGDMKLPQAWELAIKRAIYGMALNEYKEEGGNL